MIIKIGEFRMTENKLMSDEETSNIDTEMKSIFFCWADCLKKYFSIQGRSTRYEFWSSVFISIVIFLLLLAVSYIFNIGTFILEIYILYMFIPTVSQMIRRLHDSSMSGISIIPLIILFTLAYVNYEFNLVKQIFPLFCLMSYISYMFWLLSDDGDDRENIYGKPVCEAKFYNEASSVFVNITIGFLVLFWIIFIISIL